MKDQTTPDMNSLLQPFQQLFPQQHHDQIFLVGGTMRDFLLQQSAQDYDLIAVLPEELLPSLGFRLVAGKTTRPIWFQHDAQLGKLELIRLDDISQLDADLRGRDFTINAIALSLCGRLYDPLNGQQDLQQRLLRVCSEQNFVDDPLRIIRGVRFVADGWQMVPETVQLIQQQDWAEQMACLPVERFSREMVKALAARQPERFFQQMIQYRLGSDWLSELFRMPDIPAGPLQHHPEGDLLTHCLQVLQRAATVSSDPLTRFCAFFHDIGKLSTDPALYPKHHGHDEAGYKPALNLCKRLCLPTEWGRALAWISRLHTNLNRWSELRDATRLRIAEQARKAGISLILPVVSAADKPGNSTPAQWFQALEVAAMNSTQLGINVEQLEAMQEKHRPDFILQHRIRLLRSYEDIS
ncbi:tRNA nucleotidyltransferase (CCA-adding enzyme) [Trichlorobacter thiogenes]|uniref:tRNA nucleotidyltransferase (CCA-adding enzyme) n=1 Tax=Trichlorobacter thiogenes TaxID=115783 RepID=A0A1T4NMA1_9BACT|nr:HD domain-containing protein [Trichlorobacter thiogenes]SJZ80389.1 tRNA nucleotidyltransferase (CCA-adding enzyme) [Trichlorobacter thiogenes]